MNMGFDEWNCEKCTFRHKFKAQRCQMCNSLRVTKQQMRDFVSKKSVVSSSNLNVSVDDAPTFPIIKDQGIYGENLKELDSSTKILGARLVHSSPDGCNISVQRQSGYQSFDGNRNRISNSNRCREANQLNSVSAPFKAIPNPYIKQTKTAEKSLPISFVENANEVEVKINDCIGTNTGSLQSLNDSKKMHQNDPNFLSLCTNNQKSPKRSFSQVPLCTTVHTSSLFTQSDELICHLANDTPCKSNPYLNQQVSEPLLSSMTASTNTKNQPLSLYRPSLKQSVTSNNNQQLSLHTNKHLIQQNLNTFYPNTSERQSSLQSQSQPECLTSGKVSTPCNKTSVPLEKFSCINDLPYIEGPIPLCKNSCQNWIFPVDDKYPERSYQLQMSHTSIMTNTLVSLPTGLGKTLIAAVVMYNYYRWFPTGKVVFCAPTRALVTQQIQACYNIMGIPEAHTAEISGRSKPESRERIWKGKRVFFCTPHTLVKDVKEGRCDAKLIVCVVMDEAHRATGNHANALLVSMIEDAGAKFRLVGLSATPGTDIKSIQTILSTLKISRIEAKTEDDPDVMQYIHHRDEEVIVVKQPEIVKGLDKKFGELIAPILERLRKEDTGSRLLYDGANLKSFSVFQANKDYIGKTNDHSLDGHFNALREFTSIRQLLKDHGILIVKKRLLEMHQYGKPGYLGKIIKGPAFQTLLNEVLKATNITEDDGHHAVESEEVLMKNNPKYHKLREILLEHFERKANKDSTRVIVFSQWRDSVAGIVSMLNAQKHRLLKPSPFIGQSKTTVGKGKKSLGSNSNLMNDSAGMNQAQQQKVLAQFSKGIYNILVCTCVAEEGLDIGEVDLIVNFDVLKSPIRCIQRSGRTGRKRNGRVIFLVSEGMEEQSYRESVSNMKKIARALQSNKNVFHFCRNPPMFPREPILTKQKMMVTSFRFSQVAGHTPKRNRRNNDVSDMDWRLTETLEKERREKFGGLPRLPCKEYEGRHCFPTSLRRFYLKSRYRSFASKLYRLDKSRKAMIALGVGSTSTILKSFERYLLPNHIVPRAFGNAKKCDDTFFAFDVEGHCDDRNCRVLPTDLLTNFPDNTEDPQVHYLDSTRSHIHSPFKFIGCEIIDSNKQLGLSDWKHHTRHSLSTPVQYGMLTPCESNDSKGIIKRESSIPINDELLLSTDVDPTCGISDNNGSDDLGGLSERLNEQHATEVRCDSSEKLLCINFGSHRIDLNIPSATGCVANNNCELVHQTLDSISADNPTTQDLSPQKPCHLLKERELACYEKQNIQDFADNRDFCISNARNQHTTSSSRNIRLGSILNACNVSTSVALNSKLSQESLEQSPSTLSSIHVDEDKNSVIALELPTPPESSDESDEGEITLKNSYENTTGRSQLSCEVVSDGIKDSFELCKDIEPHTKLRQDPMYDDSANEFFFATFEEPNVEMTSQDGASNIQVFPLQLPTQDSSSSSEDEERSESSCNRVQSSDVLTEIQLLQPSIYSKVVEGCLSPMIDGGGMGQKLPCCSPFKRNINEREQSLMMNTPTPKHVKFKPKSSISPQHDVIYSPTDQGNKPFDFHSASSAEVLTDTPIKNTPSSSADKDWNKRFNRRKRLRPVARIEKENQSTANNNHTDRQEKMKKLIEEKYRCRFLDTEAVIDGSYVDSDEEDEIKMIEVEESHSLFINDSSQLGYTQDDLDHIDVDGKFHEASDQENSILYRQLNHQQNIADQFNTPILNRRMRQPSSESQCSEPSSQRGLGNMNFIRSVLEHHRQGGDCKQIEYEYHRLVGEYLSPDDKDVSNDVLGTHSQFELQNVHSTLTNLSPDNDSQRPFNRNENPSAVLSNSTLLHRMPVIDQSLSHETPVLLTEDQKAMIEAKRIAALKRRQQSMQQQQTVVRVNPYAK